MKTAWITGFAIVLSSAAMAQTTIYKHVDANGRITYANKPMKDATVVELEPLTTIPATPMGMLQTRPANGAPGSYGHAGPAASLTTSAPVASDRAEIRPAVAVMSAKPSSHMAAAYPSVDAATQKKRDEGRRRILEEELGRENAALEEMRKTLLTEQQNPTLVAAVRMAQTASEPTPAQMLEMRQNIEKASGRIRGLQSTFAEHQKNIEALKKELGGLK